MEVVPGIVGISRIPVRMIPRQPTLRPVAVWLVEVAFVAGEGVVAVLNRNLDYGNMLVLN
jgi:hypothetical protein